MYGTIIAERGEGRTIWVSFPYDKGLITEIKKLKGCYWHPDRRAWSVPEDLMAREGLAAIFKTRGVPIPPWLDPTDACLTRLSNEMLARGYSKRTVESYLHYNRELTEHAGKGPEAIVNDDIRAYLAYIVEKRKASISTVNIAVSALKFHYGEVQKRNFMYDVKRPRKDRKLPVVLSKEEVRALLRGVTNPKHRTLLMLVYSSGLRVSEVVRLMPGDVDLERKTIHIRRAKGRKDRYTILSVAVSESLKNYLAAYRPRKWVFPGRNPARHITIRTAQAVFESAKKAACLTKHVSIHSLRHSFATHLLEAGTDIRYIQRLLGHQSVKTTEIYTHVSNTELIKIKSPLDMRDMDEEGVDEGEDPESP